MRLRRLRVEPPWPPGLESVKKALLGPRRYRAAPAAGRLLHPYNDTLLIALALNRLLRPSEPHGDPTFRLHLGDLQITGRVDWTNTVLTRDDVIRILRNLCFDARTSQPSAECREVGIVVRVNGQIEGALLDHQVALCGELAGRPRWNARWLSALKLIRERVGWPATDAYDHCTEEDTRQMILPTSSATSRAPDLSNATPTGRPCALPSASTKPVSTSCGAPAGLPSAKGTKITL